jgi:sirohydrochlorin ferrochelatase
MFQERVDEQPQPGATARARTGLLVVGHGTRAPAGCAQCVALADLVRQHLREAGSPQMLELAFLELASPGIDEAVGRLVAQGAEALVVFPLLLFAAGHARVDIPEAVRQALAQHSAADLPWRQAAPLGCHPAILELSARQCREAVEGAFGQPGDCLLVVGRGTSDLRAQADFMDFVAQRRAAAGGARVEAAYLAQARPTLDEQLARLAVGGANRIVVQPHLLFAGELMDAIRQRVAAVAGRAAARRWLVVPPLAEGILRDPAQQVLWHKAVLARLEEAGIRVVGRQGQR